MPFLQKVMHFVRGDESCDNSDDACIIKCSEILKNLKKRKNCDMETRPAPPARSESPTPSLDSESSLPPPSNKRRRKQPRRVSFDVDVNNNVNTRSATFNKYEGEVANDVWWSKRDLAKIMKREGRLVLNLKIDASRSGDNTSCMANSLKQSINETFKKCVDAPLNLGKETPAIFEFIQDEDRHPHASTTTTTRGLERYIAPIMGAHREMVVKSLLITQNQLSNSEPNLRMDVLGSRYEHLSKIAANFAVVMAQLDAKLASANRDFTDLGLE